MVKMDHYKQRNKEAIEIIKDSLTPDEFRGFLLGNVYKYLSRYQYKGRPSEDLHKAITYLSALQRLTNNPDCGNVFYEESQEKPDYEDIK